MRRKVKKDSSAYFIKQADTLFSQLIRKQGYCDYCGKEENLQCAHIISRGNWAVRWDPKNALCLCVKHHIYGWHRDPVIYMDWFMKKYPDRYEYLMKEKNRIVKRILPDYQALVDDLKQKLSET